MRTSNIIVEKEVGAAKLGYWIDPSNGIDHVQLNQMTPFINGREDVDVLIPRPELLKPKQPIELNGFKMQNISLRADGHDDGSSETPPYTKLMNEHPSVMSFPSDVLWYGRNNGLKDFKANLTWALQRGRISFDGTKAETLANEIMQVIAENTGKYTIWGATSSTYRERLSSIMITWAIEMAKLKKVRYLSGLTPIIDGKYPDSAILSHKTNIGYANLIDAQYDSGERVPGYLYTIALNSSMIKREYTEDLKEIVRMTRAAIDTSRFNGVHVSIRGMSEISKEPLRIATTIRLMQELTDTTVEGQLPIWWSRMGLIGLRALDIGPCFTSYCLNHNIDDIYREGANLKDKMTLYGKVLDPDHRRIMDVREVMRDYPDGLSELDGIARSPTDVQMASGPKYRIGFAKPYNVLAMAKLNDQWIENISNNEVAPSKEYLRSFVAPTFYQGWAA